jgi:hypothetical protein
MRLYERSPRQFNAIIDEKKAEPPTVVPAFRENTDLCSHPVIGSFEEVFGRRSKRWELVSYGEVVTGRLSLRLSGHTKHSYG